MTQYFYCKICDKEFSIDKNDIYLNYKCPVHNIICQKKDYIGLLLKGLDTIKK